MLLTVVSIGLAQILITTDPVVGVLDNNPTAGEGRVIDHIFRRTVFAVRFLAWTEAVPVQLGNALIATVAHAVWQLVEQLGLLQELHVGGWPRHTVGNINDFPGFFIDSDLAFERVCFLLVAYSECYLIIRR